VVKGSNLRDIHRGIGKIIGGGNIEASRNLLRCRISVVANVSLLRHDSIGTQVCNAWDIRMGGWAVVAFVVIISKDLPVVFTLHLPLVVKLILVKFVSLESRLRIDASEIVIPWRGFLGTVHVDPDESIAVYMNVDSK